MVVLSSAKNVHLELSAKRSNTTALLARLEHSLTKTSPSALCASKASTTTWREVSVSHVQDILTQIDMMKMMLIQWITKMAWLPHTAPSMKS